MYYNRHVEAYVPCKRRDKWYFYSRACRRFLKYGFDVRYEVLKVILSLTNIMCLTTKSGYYCILRAFNTSQNNAQMYVKIELVV